MGVTEQELVTGVLSGWKALIYRRLLERKLVEELSSTHRRAPPAPSLIDPLKAHLADLIWWAGFRPRGRLHLGDAQTNPVASLLLWKFWETSLSVSPESAVKFSHHLTLEMVVGRVCTGWFIHLWTSNSSFFCVCNLIDGAFFSYYMLHQI